MKLILLFISIIILFFVLKFFIRETFDNSCYVKDDCIERGDTSISQVNPELPECVGICINQHTFTNENCGKNCDSIGKLKFNQSESDVIVSNCGQCINNFYQGLKNMKTIGNTD